MIRFSYQRARRNGSSWRVRLPVGLIALGLAVPLAGQERQAMLPWWRRAPERQVGHYWIKTDLPAEQAEALAAHLNLMYGEYAGRLASLPARAPTPMNVLLFAERIDYVETLRRRYGVEADDTGGMFFVNPRGTALALWTGALPRRRVLHVLRHEGFHQFAYSRFGGSMKGWRRSSGRQWWWRGTCWSARRAPGCSTRSGPRWSWARTCRSIACWP
jgi:hypothetical protein